MAAFEDHASGVASLYGIGRRIRISGRKAAAPVAAPPSFAGSGA